VNALLDGTTSARQANGLDVTAAGAPLSFRRRMQAGSAVVTPVGTLDVSTYALLRDSLLKSATDLPVAVVVDLDELEFTRTSVLSVFPTVALRLADWPGIPLLLAGDRSTATAVLASAVPRFVAVFRTVADAVAAVDAPPPHRRASLELTGAPSDPRRARVWLTDLGTAWGLEVGGELLDDAVLVASELVENAVRHAPGAGRLRVELRASRLSIAVVDGSPHPPVLVPAQAATLRGGRGVAVVDALARAWGHGPHPGGGKVVWAVLQIG
jgi:anti-sigma regulatory factor (Ser/Thr protein kinase)